MIRLMPCHTSIKINRSYFRTVIKLANHKSFDQYREVWFPFICFRCDFVWSSRWIIFLLLLLLTVCCSNCTFYLALRRLWRCFVLRCFLFCLATEKHLHFRHLLRWIAHLCVCILAAVWRSGVCGPSHLLSTYSVQRYGLRRWQQL